MILLYKAMLLKLTKLHTLEILENLVQVQQERDKR
jgi:hypothetical protein